MTYSFLAAFFSHNRFPKVAIVIGQYIGIGTLIGLSFLLAFILHITIPLIYLHFLGIAPVIIGIRQLFSIEWVIRRLQSLYSQRCCLSCRGYDCKCADNIGIYTPLFTIHSPKENLFFSIVFLLMTAIWCAGAFYLVQTPNARCATSQIGQHVLPYFLIGLGLFVLLR